MIPKAPDGKGGILQLYEPVEGVMGAYECFFRGLLLYESISHGVPSRPLPDTRL